MGYCAPIDAFAEQRMHKALRYLRLFLMDTAELNRLLLKRESDDELLTFAIEMAISDWNSTTPILGYVTIANYPSLFLLIHGAAIQILKSQGILQTRNQLNYNAGGSSFSRFDKAPMYQQWLNMFENTYQVQKRNFKIQQNVALGWGGSHSEYNMVGYYW